VEWCGEITDMPAFHDTLCLFAMISEPSGCPNASLEAMASSLPIVATAVGGAREQIEHDLNGLLTPPRDPEAMATALMELLTQPTLRAQMRQAAHARAVTHFSLEKMASSYLRLCLEPAA
jgi:glycosyltransferase involved in cell wall biosynthesis